MVSQHTVRSYEEDLERVTRDVLEMGGLVEAQLAAAIRALVRRDADLASRVINDDRRIDEIEARVDEEVTRIMALRQPMAADLRLVKVALKMASDLERMGDLAANTAKRSLVLTQADPVALRAAIARMGEAVQVMIKDVLDAFAQRDADKALSVRRRDTEVDEMYNGVFRALLTYMMEDPSFITPCTHLVFVAKNIERIGDHTTNVAELVTYLVKGETPPGDRPKSDTTSTFAGPAGAPAKAVDEAGA